MSIRTGDRDLVVVNVHFEPDLTLRNLRERLRLITPHWPFFPEAVGFSITGDLNIGEPEEERFNVWAKCQAFCRFYCSTCLRKEAPWYADALL